MKALRVLAALAFVLIAAGPLWAFPVSIDPGAYDGRYEVFPFGQPGLGFVTGVTTVDLAPGHYLIDLGAMIATSGFTFDVDATGQVTNVNAVAAHATGSTLLFNNVTVTVNPNLFAAPYYLSI